MVPVNRNRRICFRIPAGSKDFVLLAQFMATLWPTEPSIKWLGQVVSLEVERQTGETAHHVSTGASLNTDTNSRVNPPCKPGTNRMPL